MNRALLIIYEPALFLVAGLGWAAWELWSMRTPKTRAEARVETPAEPGAKPLESVVHSDPPGKT